MKPLLVYAVLLIALFLCFYFGKLLKPNKDKVLKISGYLSLLFIGPFIYIVLSCLVAVLVNFVVNIDNIKAEYIYAVFTICLILSPVAIGLGANHKVEGEKSKASPM